MDKKCLNEIITLRFAEIYLEVSISWHRYWHYRIFGIHLEGINILEE
jgi:hypothetical protein